MNIKDIEKWLLASGHFFVNCQKCPNRKVGCTKNCKFYKSYKRGKKI